MGEVTGWKNEVFGDGRAILCNVFTYSNWFFCFKCFRSAAEIHSVHFLRKPGQKFGRNFMKDSNIVNATGIRTI